MTKKKLTHSELYKIMAKHDFTKHVHAAAYEELKRGTKVYEAIMKWGREKQAKKKRGDIGGKR